MQYLAPSENKFHVGAAKDGKHYWLTPAALYQQLDAEFHFDFDPCPYPLPEGFDGLTCEWGQSNYVNPPFGSIIHQGKKKGMTAWVRKAIEEWNKGKLVVMVYPLDKWVLLLLTTILGSNAQVRNLGDIKWVAIEDGASHQGTGRHIGCFVLEPMNAKRTLFQSRRSSPDDAVTGDPTPEPPVTIAALATEPAATECSPACVQCAAETSAEVG